MTGKRVNRGPGLGLEVPVEYIFIGDTKAIDWLFRRLANIEKELNARVDKCMK